MTVHVDVLAGVGGPGSWSMMTTVLVASLACNDAQINAALAYVNTIYSTTVQVNVALIHDDSPQSQLTPAPA